VLRSLYIVQPTDAGEPARRLAQWVHKWRSEGAVTLDELEALGLRHVESGAGAEIRQLAEETAWAGPLPSDKKLAETLGMSHFYSRVYRPTSDAAHFGIGTMLAGFLEQPTSVSGEGARVSLELSDPARANEVLALAALTYGEFLTRCDPVIRHHVGNVALTAMQDWQKSEPNHKFTGP
jgi:hypothetical protein